MLKRVGLVLLVVLLLAPATWAAAPIKTMIGSNLLFSVEGRFVCSAVLLSDTTRVALTNNHCIEDATHKIEKEEVQADGTVKKVTRVFYDAMTVKQFVYANDGIAGTSEYRVHVVAFDPKLDLAIIQIDADATFPAHATIPPDSYKVEQGQVVYAVGNPAGLENSVTRGVLSHTAREYRWGSDQVAHYLQTDASITGGSSGGALYDEQGNLLGITAAGYRGVSLNFAIPFFVYKPFLKAHGYGDLWVK